MTNRIFSGAMSFYCSLMLSSSFVTASQGLKLATMGAAAPAPAFRQQAASQAEEPLKAFIAKVRKDGRNHLVGEDIAVYFGLTPASKPEALPAKILRRITDATAYVVLVTDQGDILYLEQDAKTRIMKVYHTDKTGVLKKTAAADPKTGSIPVELPAEDAKAGFDKMLAVWKDVAVPN